MLITVVNVKGGVGKTTTSVYLAAAAVGRRPVVLVDADPQASAAQWLEERPVDGVSVVEAPSERLLKREIGRDGDAVVIVDTPPGGERLVRVALSRSDAVVVPTRAGALEIVPARSTLALIPEGMSHGLVVTAARTYTRDFTDTVALWAESGEPIWGTVPERVAAAAGPEAPLSAEILAAYHPVWLAAKRRRRAKA